MHGEDMPPAPPALFGRGWFDLLSQEHDPEHADEGARMLLRSNHHAITLVPLPREEAVDIDTPADLAAITARAAPPASHRA